MSHDPLSVAALLGVRLKRKREVKKAAPLSVASLLLNSAPAPKPKQKVGRPAKYSK